MSFLVVAALDEEVEDLRLRQPDQPVLVTGPGKVLAASALAARLATDRPAQVLVLGTAGALHAGLEGAHEVGGVSQHDFDAVSIHALVGRWYAPALLLSGDGPHLATGDVFVADAVHVGRLAARGFGLVDMEGYAYAHVCAAAGVPVRIVKAVSDGADGEAPVSWAANVRRCAELLADWYDTNVHQ